MGRELEGWIEWLDLDLKLNCRSLDGPDGRAQLLRDVTPSREALLA